MYDLHRLGWSSFQQLCLTISREVLGQTVQSFLDTNDAGRDGAFAGTWVLTQHESVSGEFVIQCKFSSKPQNQLLKLSDVADEIPKVKRLVANGCCDVYVLMTNLGISGKNESTIKSKFIDAGAKHVLIFGSSWIEQQIQENVRLRMLVPRVYGLGDLSQILDERAYSQARAVLESLREDLAKVVITESYRRAVAALDDHGFVLLIGEPAAGKTTIASMLAMAAADKWKSSVIKLADPAKIIERWNVEEPSQFFWVDDAFGVTQYESSLANGWNHSLVQIRTMLRRGVKIVMTSRDYIYNRARHDLKESAFPLLKESQVVIDVHDLTEKERQQILYNHLKLGKQKASFRSEIKPHLEFVAAHPRFIPETARRISDPVFTKNLYLDRYYLARFLEKRQQLLLEVLQGLDVDSKAALGLVYIRRDHLETPIVLEASERDALERLGSTLGDCITALESLKGSLVTHLQIDGQPVWRFKHPTIGDSYAEILASSPDLLGIFLSGSSTENLILQVTCGDVGIEKAVVVPRALFPMMIVRLKEFSSSKRYKEPWMASWSASWARDGFLARRCSKEFLALYLEEEPKLLARICSPGLYLAAVSEVDLAVRLHALGLLPEANRKKFVETVGNYAVEGDDPYALSDPGIRTVFTDEEFNQLLQRVRTELLPNLTEIREAAQESRDSSKPADEHMQQTMELFDVLRVSFKDDPSVVQLIKAEVQLANDWIEEADPVEHKRTPRVLGAVGSADELHGNRSIFDDIDEVN